MVVNIRKKLFIFAVSLILIVCLCIPSFAYSKTEFKNDVPFPYVQFNNNVYNFMLCVYNTNLNYNNVNYGNLSPIGFDHLLNGDTVTSTRLPFGVMFSGIILYSTYSKSSDFYTSDDWWEFFNDYLHDNNNLVSSFSNCSLYTEFSLDQLKATERDVCRYSSSGSVSSILFGSDFLEFLYRYSYDLVKSYDFTLIGSVSYEDFRSKAFDLTSGYADPYDVSRNPTVYKDILYSFDVSSYPTADYVPVNYIFSNYLIAGSTNIFDSFFSLFNSSMFLWCPTDIAIVIIDSAFLLMSVAIIMFIKKVILF